MLKHCWLALALAGLVTIAPGAIAQANGNNDQQSAPAAAPPEHGYGHGGLDPQRRTERLTRHLSLTSEQQGKVLEIFKSAKSQMEAVHSDSSLSPEDRHSKMMEIHKSTDGQIRSLLDSTQQQKWDAMRTRQEERMEGHQAPAPQQ
jgi:periplasmic protein CpxP/Spy